MFCADLAMLGSSIYIPSMHGGDLAAYLASLERVLALAPVRMFPAHGPVIDDPPALLRAYLAHRRQREQQLLAALGDGLTTVDQLLGRLYPGIRVVMIPIARDTVIAHLQKLERDGRVRATAAREVWHLVGP
jgi:glyoxylase-like metal-dependent hydrolase (beta-lactamase superfamily II)